MVGEDDLRRYHCEDAIELAELWGCRDISFHNNSTLSDKRPCYVGIKNLIKSGYYMRSNNYETDSKDNKDEVNDKSEIFSDIKNSIGPNAEFLYKFLEFCDSNPNLIEIKISDMVVDGEISEIETIYQASKYYVDRYESEDEVIDREERKRILLIGTALEACEREIRHYNNLSERLTSLSNQFKLEGRKIGNMKKRITMTE